MSTASDQHPAGDPDEPDGDSGVGPRHAEGNKGWNEPVADAPETLEGAVRADHDGEDDPPPS